MTADGGALRAGVECARVCRRGCGTTAAACARSSSKGRAERHCCARRRFHRIFGWGRCWRRRLVGILEKGSAPQRTARSRSAAAGCKAMTRAFLLAVGLLVAAANSSFAQSPSPPPVVAAAAPQPWQSLSPEQQHLLQNYQGKWSGLPPERQQALVNGSQRWLSMTPEQRSSAQQRFSQWRALPPQQRQVLRQRWQQFKSLPPEQQQRVRENFQRFRRMPPERRMELRRQWHQMSPEQRRSVIQRGPPPRH